MAKVFYEKGKKYNCVVTGKPYFRTSVTINGKVHQVYGDGEKDARRKVDELKTQAEKGLNLDYRGAKVGPTMKMWLYDIKRVDKDLKASSFAAYEAQFRNHIEPYPICSVLLKNLTRAHIQQYVSQLYERQECEAPTIQAALRVVHMFVKWAVDEGILVKDVCKGVVIPGKYSKTKRDFEVFTEAERAKLLSYMDRSSYQYDTLIKLAFATGMRKGELLALRWEDIYDGAIHVQRSTARAIHVDGDGNRTHAREVWEPKTKNAVREIPLLKETQKMLSKHKVDQMEFFLANRLGKPEYVFTTTNGTLIEATNLYSSYKSLLEHAGIKYRKFHAIRHTFATEAIRHGVDVKDLQLLMGHSDISMTYRYVQSDKDSKRNAIEMMGVMM